MMLDTTAQIDKHIYKEEVREYVRGQKALERCNGQHCQQILEVFPDKRYVKYCILQKFKNLIEVAKKHRANLGIHPGLLIQEATNQNIPTDNEIDLTKGKLFGRMSPRLIEEASGSAKLSGHGAYGMPPCRTNYRSGYTEQSVAMYASGFDPA
eukprot:5237136-Ditylum_brightwellii.AAC.1